MKKNFLQFSVVREDPEVELALFRQYDIKKPILIGSGGCTALAIAAEFKDMTISLIEPNPTQIKLIKEKIKSITTLRGSRLTKKFGVDKKSDPKSLIEKGNFESLFRSHRNFIFEFIADEKQIEKLLKKGSNKNWEEVFAHPYWKVSFDLFFSNSILLAMFGPAAIQHGPFAENTAQSANPDHVHMICAPKDSDLDATLRKNFQPSATASILAHRMTGVDWSFILTSDI